MSRTPLGAVSGMAFGGDYNPEQWPPDVWNEDMALMQEAGVNLVSVAIFSWSHLEPEPGRYEFGWLDVVMDRLAEAGIGADLANATASPPPWMAVRHPETLPVTAEGHTLWPGARQAYCPSSPVFREYATALTRRIAERYANHPALTMWHVSNEIGCHNARCYCDVSAAAFRAWLQRRYGDLDALNRAWGTSFWSQRRTAWDEIHPPRLAPSFINPTQQLDFRRFSSDACLEVYKAERDVLREITPHIPITTNFMVTQFIGDLDYATWVDEVDVLANDHYLDAADPAAAVELAFSADLCRGLAQAPWMVMEHSTSAVNWQPRNVAKGPGEMIRNSLQHVARGSDAVMFFQWRASVAGAEKFHSAMLPHAGTDSKVWREVVDLGAALGRLSEVKDSTVDAEVALLFDWESSWAAELDAHPTSDLRYLDQAHALYRTLWDRGVTVDVVPPCRALDGYRLVLVPTLYLASRRTIDRLEAFVSSGGTAVVTYFSGIADENDHIYGGGFPGAFRSWLGIRTEEFFPLRKDEVVLLDNGATADLWTELLDLDGAEAVARYVDGPLPGIPAITRNRHGDGTAWYLATRLDRGSLDAVMADVLAETGVKPPIPMVTAPDELEVVRRRGDGGSYLFLINHGTETAHVRISGHELIADREIPRTLSLRAGDVAVVREVAG